MTLCHVKTVPTQPNLDLGIFGATLRGLRVRAKLSQESLAANAGIDRSYLSAVERGEHNLALINILKIAAALDVPPSELLAGYTKVVL